MTTLTQDFLAYLPAYTTLNKYRKLTQHIQSMNSKPMTSLLIAAAAALSAAGLNAQTRTMTLQDVTYNVDTLAHYKAGPAMKFSRLAVRSAANTFAATVLEIDMKAADAPQIKVEVGCDSVKTAEKATSIAIRKSDADKRYVAAMNGDFFITSSFTENHQFGNQILGFPNTTCASMGKLIAPDAIDYGSREKCFVLTTDGNMFIDATDLSGTFSYPGKKSDMKLYHTNYVRTDTDIILYNSSYGGWTKTDDTGVEVALELQEGESWGLNRPVKMRVVSLPVEKGNSRIPENGAVISAGKSRTSQINYIKQYKVGDEVVVNLNVTLPKHGIAPENISEIIGGDVRILNQGNVTYVGDPDALRFINSATAKYQRSLIGYSEDRSKLVWCTVEGSIGGGGASYYDAADLMRELGCYDALDLDGGGSTMMYLRTPGIVNVPRDGAERAVGNGIFAVVNAPEDNTVREVRFADHAVKLPQYGAYKPVFYGYNGNGELISMDVKDVEVSVPSEFGSVLADGSVLATKTGCFPISASYNGHTTTVAATVQPASEIKPKYTSVLIDNYRDWQVELTTEMNGTTMPISAAAMSWVSTDSEVASISADGYVKGLKEGQTTLRGTLNDIVVEVNLTVEIPAAREVMSIPASQVSNYSVSKTTGIAKGYALSQVENGFNVAYRVSSTRGTLLNLAAENLVFPSLPDGIRFAVKGNPDYRIYFDFSTSAGVNFRHTVEPLSSTDGEVNIKFGDYVDTEDMAAVYPIALRNIIAYPLSPKTSTDYNIKVAKPTLIYNNADPAGVEDIIADGADSNGAVEYFDITGCAVSNPVKGNFYIRRQGTKVEKIIF